MGDNNLKLALTELMYKEADELMVEYESYEFSPEFEEKMEKLIKRRRKPYFRMINTVGKRVACIAACAFIVSSASLMSVDAVREAVFGFIMNIFEDHSDISFEDDGKHPDTIQDIYEIGYDMSDYEISFEVNNDKMRSVEYMDNKGNSIVFEQYVEDAFNLRINTEDATVSHIDLNGYDAMYYYDNNSFNNLIWDNGQYIFYISSNLTKEKTISVAESVQKVENK